MFVHKVFFCGKQFPGSLTVCVALAASIYIPSAYGSLRYGDGGKFTLATLKMAFAGVEVNVNGGEMAVTGAGADTTIVRGMIDGQPLGLVFGPKFLMAPMIPSGIGIFDASGHLKAGYSGRASIIGPMVSDETKGYTIKWSDGTSMPLSKLALPIDEIDGTLSE